MNSLFQPLLDFFSRYAGQILFYLPLGIIGIWRWSVWLIRKIISLFYRQPGGRYQTSLSIVAPVYNEDPEIFLLALHSWKNNDPDEIIAVIDYTDTRSIEIFKDFASDFSGARLIVTKKPGKRPALADGTKAAKSEIVSLVDSDTIWSPGMKNKILGPFSDPKVGGLVTRQDVFETNTLARKLFKILLDDRYLLEYPFLATVSNALLCLSGRTAVYRRIAIIDEMEKLVNEKFWGAPMISGDDKSLTHLVQSKGWETRYLRDVKVYASGTPKLSNFIKQKLRWTRNGLRSDSKVLGSKWLWKNHKVLAIHMLDKFVSPITLLLGPIYFIVSLYFGYWQIAVMLFLWWMISRTIKIFPHLREEPRDIFILPAYLAMTFVMAIVKIYALLTINEQGWITRWDKSRLHTIHFFKRIPSYAATSMVLAGMFFVVFNYKYETIKAAATKKANQEQASRMAVFTPDLPKMSPMELSNIENRLTKANQADPYGYYIVKAGDTMQILRNKFNMLPSGKIFDAKTKRPLGVFSAFSVGQQIAIPVSDLRNPINKSILAPNIFAKAPMVSYDAPNNTINVKQGGSVATLSKINQGLSFQNKRLLEQISAKEWILRANLYIGKNVTLVVDGDEAKYLKLKSDASGFVWIRSESGNIFINDTRITSWNEKENAPDTNNKDGRSYITARNSGRMDIIGSELAYLGYEGLPNRGGPFGGSYGVSWKINNGSFRERLLTGVVMGNKFHSNYFGLYTYGATGMLISGNAFYDNIVYGIDPHDDSNNFLIEKNIAYNNGSHGIIISKRCFSNQIVNNTAFNNHLHGIMLDRESNNNMVQDNTVYGNVDGIAIYGSNDNLVFANEIRNNTRGIRLNAASAGNYFKNNNILSNSRGVYVYDQSQKNIFTSNKIRSNAIGITIKNANENSFFDNFEIYENTRDVRITDDAHGNNMQ